MDWLRDRNALLERVRAQMHEKRYQHTLGVAASARELALRFGGDPDKAELAGFLHDYCKCWPVDQQRDILVRHDLPDELLNGDKELWHAFAGAIVIQSEMNVTDPAVIQAVRYHTTGRPGMTLLEKIVCVADYIEPGRDFSGVDKIRELAQKDLDRALATAFGGTIKFLIKKQKTVFPLTLLAYNDLVSRLDT
ncbi:bis(5'-nucleosyl)-tetraphosphatase (symmetrical) YqeK [Brevibacillus ruminantium]|uniref:bis(5'-nucleosyl)-tetraphosphatase (symmetrical) n=1 Tax=Brevibacillus ruminantium TaxID=2950604 RepID=A0ABY4W9S0_9BACL|nr:bis(5'-nucleosyl)-tetraphosphatase (symmetrical) YqeK [Brevibacillus ruminantium]USG63915.1 bis(5'-nucleosyl)-tetraphosphatase (symmetrical) YqeK [Brevibacillus ruminantium]